MVPLTLKRPPEQRNLERDSVDSLVDHMTTMTKDTSSNNEHNQNTYIQSQLRSNVSSTTSAHEERGSQVSKSELIQRVIAECGASRDWRTAWGVGQKIGYSPDAVQNVLVGHPDLFETSPLTPAGIPLYRLRDSYRRLLSAWTASRGADKTEDETIDYRNSQDNVPTNDR